jgi:MFS family permease
MITGLMAVGRYFAGPVIHALNPVGVLLVSSVVAAIGIYFMSIASGGMVYVAAILFALGVMYFWPTMIGFVSEYLPKTGALGMSLVGGAGMFGVSIWNPIIGGWLDDAKAEALEKGLSGPAAELAAGQAALSNLALFPVVLIFIFAGLFIFRKKFQNN